MKNWFCLVHHSHERERIIVVTVDVRDSARLLFVPLISGQKLLVLFILC